MKVIIEQAILHGLDQGAGAPVLSQAKMEMDSRVEEYLAAHFWKCMENDGAQRSRFQQDSRFLSKLSRFESNFIEESQHLAEDFYKIVLANPQVPSGDLLCMLCRDGAGKKYFAALKMNYQDGFSHYYMNGCLAITPQRTLLPGTGRKLEEAFIIEIDSREILLIEKKYQMADQEEGRRESYISSKILQCDSLPSERSKLEAVKKAVQQVNREILGNQKAVEQELLSRLHVRLHEEAEPTVGVLCEEIFQDYPQLESAMESKLAAEHIQMRDTVQVSAATLKRLEKQSVKATGGIEIKIPAELYRDPNAVEFINNPDGTVSLLVKNILL